MLLMNLFYFILTPSFKEMEDEKKQMQLFPPWSHKCPKFFWQFHLAPFSFFPWIHLYLDLVPQCLIWLHFIHFDNILYTIETLYIYLTLDLTSICFPLLVILLWSLFVSYFLPDLAVLPKDRKHQCNGSCTGIWDNGS